MMVADEDAPEEDPMRAERTTPLPFGFGVLVGTKGVAIDPTDEQVPWPFATPTGCGS
ncbi:hypothetical protein ACIRSU_14375 [Streptomyces sp. NPDC101160]|uniref:hypothetical protein n=1 Tax=Streptomyces sp. NPDC101160 TaxID=3366118 RepID=UPI0037FAFB6D